MLAVLLFPQSELKHFVFLYYRSAVQMTDLVILAILSPSIQLPNLCPIKLCSLFLYKSLFAVYTPI